jgi:hypothetical protein
MPYIETIRNMFTPFGGLSKVGIDSTGGTITTAGGYRIHTFTTGSQSGNTFTFAADKAGIVEYLIVAGGGGGGDGSGGGGGGGAGGFRTGNVYVQNGNTTVTVGGGGNVATSGGNSSFANIISTGGGYGASYGSLPAIGGSGGGGPRDGSGTLGADGISGQGFKGGNSIVPGFSSAAGGGGAGQVGYDAAVDSATLTTNASRGGDGLASSFSGTSTFYAGGGAGSWHTGSVRAVASLGGGGQSAGWQTGGAIATAGTNGLGGGGGGGDARGPSLVAKNGGSGIIIVRYPV